MPYIEVKPNGIKHQTYRPGTYKKKQPSKMVAQKIIKQILRRTELQNS